MNENVDIFIGCHRQYSFPKNNIYKIIYNGEDVLQNTSLQIYCEENETLHDLFADAARIDYIANNIKLKEYVGLVQYRRYFDFYENVPDIHKIFEDHGIIVATPQPVMSLYDQFCECHDEYTLNICLQILNKYYPYYPSTANDWKSIRYIIPHNMFIMRTDDFYKMHAWLFDILNKFVDYNNFKTMDDVYNYISKHYPQGNDGTKHRLCGYLCERLLSIYFSHNFTNPKYIDVINT